MRMKKLAMFLAMTMLALTVIGCGGKKTAPPKDDTPELRQNKADMMERMGGMAEEEEDE